MPSGLSFSRCRRDTVVLVIDRLRNQRFLSSEEAQRLHKMRHQPQSEFLSIILNAEETELTEKQLDLPAQSLRAILWALSLDPTPQKVTDEKYRELQEEIDYLKGNGEPLLGVMDKYPLLRPFEARLLTILSSNPGRLVSFDTLHIRMLEDRDEGDMDPRANIRVRLSHIRKKYPHLKDKIVSVSGVGYRWLGDDDE
jgi:hypothetical protein